jgi:hypothetical protein
MVLSSPRSLQNAVAMPMALVSPELSSATTSNQRLQHVLAHRPRQRETFFRTQNRGQPLLGVDEIFYWNQNHDRSSAA